MVMQWARAHFGAGRNVVLGFLPSVGAAERVVAPRAPQAEAMDVSWLDRLDRWFWRQEQKRREAFLAEAADIVELEQRMRKLERIGNTAFR